QSEKRIRAESSSSSVVGKRRPSRDFSVEPSQNPPPHTPSHPSSSHADCDWPIFVATDRDYNEALESNRSMCDPRATIPTISAVIAVICAIGFCSEPAEALTETMKLGGLRGVSQNNAEIHRIARFAVERHNEKQNSALEFVRVVNAKEQVVAGIMYHLILEVTDGGRKKKYSAKVWEKLWENFKELQEFKPVDDNPSYASPGLGVGHVRRWFRLGLSFWG
ncbi:Cysteine proteinase inhibitor 6, partial [Striga hermonthica]